MTLSTLIEELNSGDIGDFEESYLKIFDSYENIFRILDKKGLLSSIDFLSDNARYGWGNNFFLYLLNNHKEKFFKIYPRYSSEVVIENGTPFLILSGLKELSELFCNEREYGSNIVSQILSGEYYFDHSSSELIDNVYTQIIEELSPSNLTKLSEIIVNELEGTPIDPSTDLLLELSSKNGEVIVNDTNINWILKDEETMTYLLDEYLNDLESNLKSIYVGAYESSLLGEAYDDAWESLSRFFVNDIEYFTQPNPYRKDSVIEKIKVRIWNFESDIKEFLEDNLNTSDYILDYYYLSMLVQLPSFECLRLSIPEWADYKLMKTNINLYFDDYL
jgi:hypothetical protein